MRDALAESRLDGLLITHLPNLRYLTGFSGSHGWLLLAADRAVFLSDPRYAQQAQEEIGEDLGIEIAIARDGVLGAVAGRAAEWWRGARAGFESKALTYGDWERLRAEASAVEWVGTAGVVERLRAVKDEAEIAMLGRAAEIGAAALRETLAFVGLGVRECEVASELDYRLRRFGAEGPAFATIVASGPRTALPHAATSERAIEEGDLLLFDFGARWRGYASDLTRTFVVGQATPRQREIHGLVLAAQRAACEALRAGTSARDVDAASRRVFAAAGLEERFLHSTGHGLGLEVHEGPTLRREAAEPLAAGMVVTVEPGLYFAGWGGIRIEDDLLVTDGQPRALSRLEDGGLRELGAGRQAGTRGGR